MICVPKQKREVSLVPNYLVLSLLVMFALGPIMVLGFNSLKSNAEVGINPLGPPNAINWENFPRSWQTGGFGKTALTARSWSSARSSASWDWAAWRPTVSRA